MAEPIRPIVECEECIHSWKARTERIRLNPRDPVPYSNRGARYSVLGQWERAIQDYDEAIRLNHRSIGLVYMARSAAYGRLGNWTKSAQDYAKYQELTP
jgi:tetratricopeptide (TPR) repeat protein